MKNLELLDLENISGGDFWNCPLIEGKHIFYAVMSLEVIAFVIILAEVASKSHLYYCGCTD